jgi:hypothetical protein
MKVLSCRVPTKALSLTSYFRAVAEGAEVRDLDSDCSHQIKKSVFDAKLHQSCLTLFRASSTFSLGEPFSILLSFSVNPSSEYVLPLLKTSYWKDLF